MRRPRSWAELEAGLAYLFGGGEFGAATAREFLQQAVLARYGVESLFDLPRWQRQVAFQKSAGAALDLQEAVEGDLAFYPSGTRRLVREAFARFFDGAVVEGPPWRLDPSELDRPTYEDELAAADFANPPNGGETLVPERVR